MTRSGARNWFQYLHVLEKNSFYLISWDHHTIPVWASKQAGYLVFSPQLGLKSFKKKGVWGTNATNENLCLTFLVSQSSAHETQAPGFHPAQELPHFIFMKFRPLVFILCKHFTISFSWNSRKTPQNPRPWNFISHIPVLNSAGTTLQVTARISANLS